MLAFCAIKTVVVKALKTDTYALMVFVKVASYYRTFMLSSYYELNSRWLQL